MASMNKLPFSLFRAQQVRELDRIAIEDFAIPGFTLMTCAGNAAFDLLQMRWPWAKKISVFCGVGNNAGDGYILARLARQAGLSVTVTQLGEVGLLKGDASAAYQAWLESGGRCEPYTEKRFQSISPADVVVDALLGTGLKRPVEGDWRDAIAAMNRQRSPILAIDIPSGLDADTGDILGIAVKADATISFIGLKQGMFTGRGRDCCGSIFFDHLDVPLEAHLSVTPSSFRIQPAQVDDLLPKRAASFHKGDAGHVLVIGGDHGMAGAVRMAAEAAARVGAGLVSVASRTEHGPQIVASRPELMCHGVESPEQLSGCLSRASVVAIGPGLGQSEWSKSLLARVLETRLPMVVDADAINLLAQNPIQNEQWVLTPHPGEAARLLQTDTRSVQQDRFFAASQIVQRYGGVCVLKGSGSLVASANAPTRVCDLGNPGMASGGMGDVLTGVIAGLLAQGLSPEQAASAGVYIHAHAADLCASDGERGILATDLFCHLRKLVNPQRE